MGIVGLAAHRVTADDIAELKSNLIRSKEAVVDTEAFLESDMNLHKKITEIARNPILARMYDSISQLNFASRSRTGEIAGVKERSYQDHIKIVAALEARDPQAAQRAMLSILIMLKRGLRLFLTGMRTTANKP